MESDKIYYVTTLQAAASVRFPPGARYEIQSDEEKGPRLALWTRYADCGLQEPVPTGLIAAIGTEAAGLNEAASMAVGVFDRIAPLLALVGNGARPRR